MSLNRSDACAAKIVNEESANGCIPTLEQDPRPSYRSNAFWSNLDNSLGDLPALICPSGLSLVLSEERCFQVL